MKIFIFSAEKIAKFYFIFQFWKMWGRRICKPENKNSGLTWWPYMEMLKPILHRCKDVSFLIIISVFRYERFEVLATFASTMLAQLGALFIVKER